MGGRKNGQKERQALQACKKLDCFFLEAEPDINKYTVLYVERFTMSHVLFVVVVVFLKILSPQLGALSQDKLM